MKERRKHQIYVEHDRRSHPLVVPVENEDSALSLLAGMAIADAGSQYEPTSQSGSTWSPSADSSPSTGFQGFDGGSSGGAGASGSWDPSPSIDIPPPGDSCSS